MIQAYLATAALSASVAFGAGWQINDWKHDANEKQAIEQAASDQRELHRLEQARSSAALGTQVAARKSEARLRADAAASQSALVSLQSSADQAMRTAALDAATCRAVSHALGELFVASAGAYRGMAETADACLIDLRAQLDTP